MKREISQDRLLKDVHRVLENPVYIPDINPHEIYNRLHDDHDGSGLGILSVFFSENGDAWINIVQGDRLGPLRFRTPMIGGGNSPRVRNALAILALAIKLDRQEKPQGKNKDL